MLNHGPSLYPRTPCASPPVEEDAKFLDQLVVDVCPSGYSFQPTKSSTVSRPTKESTEYFDLLSWYESAVKPIDDDFCNRHLSHCLFDAQNREGEISAITNKLNNVTKIEAKLYPNLAKLLTIVSEEVYDTLSDDEKMDLEGRLQASGHLEFIKNHTKAPSDSEFPLLNIDDEPDLLAVIEPSRFSDDKGKFNRIPHHYVETLVEVKADDSNALPQAATYAYQHQQARPDQPAFLCLIAKPNYYQFLLSEPSGIIPSPRFPWTQLTPLASFLYTIYVPPQTHFFHDSTLRWFRSHKDGKMKWNITSGGQEYTDGQCVCVLGDAWGRRSSVYYAVDGNSHVVIKEYYLDHKRRFDEAGLLNHIHADGDVPGVVRLKSAEDVKVGDAVITCGSEEEGDKRTKRRLVLYDVGFEMSKATGTNSILKVLYDVLEVHRTLVRKRGILHRDMSIHNILMAPRRRKLDRPVMNDRPPFIDDMLQGCRPEYLSTRDAMSIPRCLLIDFDNGSRLCLENEEDTPHDELTARTGTPKYIARSVCLGQAFISGYSTMGAQMPELSGRALELYQAVRGMEHYERYNEKEAAQGMLMHGGLPPRDFQEIVSPPEFFHRPEHDVESVFWTMFAVLARAQPASGPEEEYVPAELRNRWVDFDTHEITSNPTAASDKRDALFGMTRQNWRDMFAPFPAMRGIADLLFEISKQVRSEYALWDWVHQPEPDHLHEAVQRLIFQYLVDHPDDIALDPERKRPINKRLPSVPRQRNPIQPQPSRGDESDADGHSAASNAGTPAASGGTSLASTLAERPARAGPSRTRPRTGTAATTRSSGKAPTRTSWRLQMPPPAAGSGSQRSAKPVASTSASTEVGAGRRSMRTARRPGNLGSTPASRSDTAGGRAPPRPSRGARGGQASQSSRTASKRGGDDQEESTGGGRKRRKR